MGESSSSINGKTVVITGASDGIGAITAERLHADGARVIVVGRSEAKTAAVSDRLGVDGLTADFADLAQVQLLAGEIAERTDRIDVLMNNAGGTFKPSKKTVDGHEPNFQINHLAPFLLTNLVKQQLAKATGRVINTASVASNWGRVKLSDLDYERRHVLETSAYGTSKLMNILFTRGIRERWSADGITSAAVHPGPAASNFGRDSLVIGLAYRTPLKGVLAITPEKGAAPLIELATRPSLADVNGLYFARHKKNGKTSKQASDQNLISGLWDVSEKIVGLAS